MTEDEMKTKWCPHRAAAIELYLLPSQSLSADMREGESRCIGSACAMWVEIRADWRHPENGEVFPEAGEVIGGRCGLVR